MNITLYNDFSKKINSTKQPSGGHTKNVRLKEGCSILHPVFRCLFDSTDEANYIKWGSNYYYIDDSVINSNDEIEYHCTRDALATFKGEIGSQPQFVTRASNFYDSTLLDMKYPTLAEASIQKVNVNNLDSQINTSGTYVVGVASPSADMAVSYYTFGSGNFAQFLSYMFSDTWLDTTNADITTAIQKELVNPFQYIVSCMWFPLDIYGEGTTAKFGFWDSGIVCGLLSKSDRVEELLGSVALPNHPQQSDRGLYVNSAPFTKLSFNCWSWGTIPLDPVFFIRNRSVGFRILVDLFTGLGDLVITDGNGVMVDRQTAQFGVPVQLSQVSQNLLNSGMSVLSGASSAVAGVVTGNVVGGVIGAVQGIGSAIQSSMPQVRTSGATGSKISYSEKPQITCTFYRQTNVDDATMGRPLMKVYTPAQLGGYMECSNVELSTRATPSEKQEIISYMEGGFFYE